MPRQCTYDYKIKVIERFVRRELLGYKPYERTLPLDLHAHEMHMGIMWEERRRAKPSKLTLFENRYPLVEMGWTRPMCYTYNREVLGIQTRASCCLFCPFHTNYFYQHIQSHEPSCYTLSSDWRFQRKRRWRRHEKDQCPLLYTAGNPKKLIKPVVWTVLADLVNLFPFGCLTLVVSSIYLYFGGTSDTLNTKQLWLVWGGMVILAIILYLFERKAVHATYHDGYDASAKGRVQLAEHIRKLPLGFLMSKDPRRIGQHNDE